MRTILLFLILGFGTVYAGSTETYIPKKAYKYLPTLMDEVNTHFPDHPYPPYFPALVEQESCIHLKHRRCWDPSSELKTKREQGVGFGQITRAWNKAGKLRFDTLEELVRKHRDELKDLSWKNIKQRPDLQLRAIVLLYKDKWSKLPASVTDPLDRLAMTDLAYNGGMGRIYKNRRVCGLSANCDPNKYFDNVENYCTASKKPLYGNRSACDIMKDHVEKTLLRRNFKYEKYPNES